GEREQRVLAKPTLIQNHTAPDHEACVMEAAAVQKPPLELEIVRRLDKSFKHRVVIVDLQRCGPNERHIWMGVEEFNLRLKSWRKRDVVVVLQSHILPSCEFQPFVRRSGDSEVAVIANCDKIG